jgi:hypothetical protein
VSVAADLAKRHQALKSNRAQWETHWREVAERVLPRQNDFFGAGLTPGAKRTDKIFDSTGEIALTKFAAVMEALLTPRTQTWHKLKPKREELNEIQPVKLWYEHVNKVMFSARYSPRARFATMAHEHYMSLGAFGTAPMFIDKAPLGPLLYKACHIGQVYFADNAWGVTDTVHREFNLTARQAVQQFGNGNLPAKIRAAETKTPDQEFQFLHCVKPNAERVRGKRDYTGMPWASYYICPEHLDSEPIETGGYASFPWAISRYVTAPSETYGRSPAMSALPDVKMLNEVKKVYHRAAHLAIDPPWLTSDENAMQPVHMRPGAVNRQGVDENGRPRILPMHAGAAFDVNMELTEQLRDTVNDVFLVRILQIILENPQMTATQVLEISQQKGVLLAPVMGRQQSEFLGPLIEREFDLLYQAGMIPEPPEEMMLYGDDEYDVDYESPLALAQKAQVAVGIARTIELTLPIAQIDPSAWDNFDLDDMVRRIGEANGLPETCKASKEKIEEIRDQRAAQQELVAGLNAAEQGGAAAKDIAQAAQIMYDDKGRVSQVRAA